MSSAGSAGPRGFSRSAGSRGSWDSQARIERALQQPIYVLDRAAVARGSSCRFHVEGTTGSVYTVTLGPEECKCTCMDFRRRQLACKHIYCVLLRVGEGEAVRAAAQRLASEQPIGSLVWRRARRSIDVRWRDREVAPEPESESESGSDTSSMRSDSPNSQMFERGDSTDGESSSEEEEVSAAGASLSRTPRGLGEDCMVCFETVDACHTIRACTGQCRRAFHEECMKRWERHSRRSTGRFTCPACRSRL